MVVVFLYVALQGKTSGILCHVLHIMMVFTVWKHIEQSGKNDKEVQQKWCTQKKMR